MKEINILVVVDMQNDFIDGSLGTKEAEKIVPEVVKKINEFSEKGNVILYTQDTHYEDYLSTLEGQKLPVKHCIYKTQGWELHPDVKAAIPNLDNGCIKNVFGSIELAQNITAVAERMNLASVTLVGLCTDVCVISNALLIKAGLPNTEIYVDAKCCAGVTPESHETALKAMEACQINVIR